MIWRTQGSGKSLLMAFYAGLIIKHPAMQNPTLVILTDRNDLDDQLFATFSMCKDLLRQTPQQAEDREHQILYVELRRHRPGPRQRPHSRFEQLTHCNSRVEYVVPVPLLRQLLTRSWRRRGSSARLANLQPRFLRSATCETYLQIP